MTPIAPYVEAFLRETLSHHRGASQHTWFMANRNYCRSGTVPGLPISPIPTTRTFAGSVLLALRDTA